SFRRRHLLSASLDGRKGYVLLGFVLLGHLNCHGSRLGQGSVPLGVGLNLLQFCLPSRKLRFAGRELSLRLLDVSWSVGFSLNLVEPRLAYLFSIRGELSLQLVRFSLIAYNPGLLRVAYRFLLGAREPRKYLACGYRVAFPYGDVHNSTLYFR